jgi:phosphoglycerate dehydrogenase-like enzyme
MNYTKMVGLDTLDEVLSATDILILTLPLTDKTYRLINAERLQILKENAVLVNIARGAVVDTNALIGSISKLGGAVLDVFEGEEPLDEKSLLWDMENVILTPHNSFVGDGNQCKLTNLILRHLAMENT